MCDDKGKPFIATLYNVIFDPELCDRLFNIITIMNLVHTCLFHKWFCTVLFSANEKNAMTLPHTSQRKRAFLVKMKENSKTQMQIPRKKVSLRLLHQRLGHRSTRSILAGSNASFWQYIDLRVYPYPFCTSCQISTIKKSLDQIHL